MLRRFLSNVRIRSFSRANRDWWASVAETVFAATLLLTGVIVLALAVTLAVLFSTSTSLYITVGQFSLQLLVGFVLVGIGAYRIISLLWKVGVSAERRGAIVSRAGEIELLNEIRRRREDLPTVPLDRFPARTREATAIQTDTFSQKYLGLVTGAIFSTGFSALATILISTSVASLRAGSYDWFAISLSLPIFLAACWLIYQFYRQLLKLSGIGSTSLEISDYPLLPGNSYQAAISQHGRVRLRLLDVVLVCQEEATFNEGTDIRTETATVFEKRLFRQRGILVKPDVPFESEFEFKIPSHGMHSFKSANNRVQWKIMVIAQAKKWPQLSRNFTVSVHPSLNAPNSNSAISNASSRSRRA